jgi:spore germination protein PD
MKMSVINNELSVGTITINELSSSSVFLIGDTEIITCSSISDTTSESPVSVPMVPPSLETRGT